MNTPCLWCDESVSIHGVGLNSLYDSLYDSLLTVYLSSSMSNIPAAVTEVRRAPRVTQVCLRIRSSLRNRKKEARFPMTPESFRIAQNIPEFLVIVSLSELCVRNVPWTLF